MENTKRFIELVLKGTEEPGYELYNFNGTWGIRKDDDFFEIHYLLLQPKTWQAVGKVKGWDKKVVVRRGTIIGNFCTPLHQCFEEMGFGMDYLAAWLYHQHRFIDLLADGKTIEEALGEILK